MSSLRPLAARPPGDADRHPATPSVAMSKPGERDPLLRRSRRDRRAVDAGTTTVVALGVAACAVVALAGRRGTTTTTIPTTRTTPRVARAVDATPTPTPTPRARLGAAVNARQREAMLNETIAVMTAKAADVEAEAERALRKSTFELSDLTAAERAVATNGTCASKESMVQAALERRVAEARDREKATARKRKKIDKRRKASNDTAALGLNFGWVGNVVEHAGTVTSWSSEIIGEYAQEVDEGSGFCWRESYTRDGIIPQYCGDDCKKEIVGAGCLYCYDKCSNFGAGYYRFGYDCHQSCSSGWDDHGLLCSNPDASYGRGVGTIECEWSWSTFSVRCGGDLCTKKGKEDYLGLCYDKCRSGYSNFGSNICTMDCQDQGYEGGIAPSCTKHTHLSPGMEPATCPPGYEYDAGLCYEPCKEGFVGAAFVCWGDPPTVNANRWVECGMGAAADDATCALVVTDQIMGPLEMVAFFATLGASSGATTGAKIGVKTATKCAKAADKIGDTAKAVKKTAEELKDAYDNIDQVVSTADGIAGGIEDMMSVETEADAIRAAAEVAALFDPTGISSTVAAYSHDICTRYTEAQVEADANPTDPELFEAQKKAVARAMQLWDQGESVERCGKAITWQMTVKYGRSAEEAAELREQVEAALTAASTSSTPTAA